MDNDLCVAPVARDKDEQRKYSRNIGQGREGEIVSVVGSKSGKPFQERWHVIHRL